MYTNLSFNTSVSITHFQASNGAFYQVGQQHLPVTNEWLTHLENGVEVCSIFFDLKKAFDSVPHCLLLQCLDELGIDPFITQWVRSYLTNRCHAVCSG